MSMDRLPDIPLLTIFRYIDDYRQLIKLERVCRKWRKIMLKDGWKHVQRVELVSQHKLKLGQNVRPSMGLELMSLQSAGECSYPLNYDSDHVRPPLNGCFSSGLNYDSDHVRPSFNGCFSLGGNHSRQVPNCLDAELSWSDFIKSKAHWIEPIGARCGDHLVECSFSHVLIDSNMIRLIMEHFPKLKHLDFRFFRLDDFDSNALNLLREAGTRLRSLTYFDMCNPPMLDKLHLLRQFPRLRHLGLHVAIYLNLDSLPGHFFADLRALYMRTDKHISSSSFQYDHMLKRVQKDTTGLSALYLDNFISGEPQQLLSRISEFKNLRFLRINLGYNFPYPDLFCSCLASLTQLAALQLILPNQQLSRVFRPTSLCFHGLVHLGLSPIFGLFDNFVKLESIGLLATIAPRLRSLNLDIPERLMEHNQGIGNEVLKIAHNGILEHLDLPCVSFTIEELDQLIRLCPNFYALRAQLRKGEQQSEVVQLRSVVADQWQAGTRKHLPLLICICGQWAESSSVYWRDSFLTIRVGHLGFKPSNPVLDELFQNEVFNDDAGTPSFVKEHYTLNSSIV